MSLRDEMEVTRIGETNTSYQAARVKRDSSKKIIGRTYLVRAEFHPAEEGEAGPVGPLRASILPWSGSNDDDLLGKVLHRIHGVQHQVENHLLQLHRIAEHGGQILSKSAAHHHLAQSGQTLIEPGHVLQSH
jgi:hypothetical protein